MRYSWVWQKKVLVLLSAAVAIVSPLLSAGQADAAVFGRDQRYGYFNNLQDTSGQKLDNDGIEYIQNVDQFVDYYRNGVNGSGKRYTAASFTVLHMLGYGPGTPKATASSVFPEWELRVRAYDAAGRINYNASSAFTLNTYWQDAHNDVAWYETGPQTETTIKFTHSNGDLYDIKKDCANPIGNSLPLDDVQRERVTGRVVLEGSTASSRTDVHGNFTVSVNGDGGYSQTGNNPFYFNDLPVRPTRTVTASASFTGSDGKNYTRVGYSRCYGGGNCHQGPGTGPAPAMYTTAGNIAVNPSATNPASVWIYYKVDPPPPTEYIEYVVTPVCERVRVRAVTPGGNSYNAQLIRDGTNSLSRNNIPNNTWHVFDVKSLQGDGSHTYRVRVTDTVTGKTATSPAPGVTVPACPPTVNAFSANCEQISVRAQTASGDSWVAEIYADGSPSGVNFSAASGSTRSVNDSHLDWNRFHDIRAHSFRVRVVDQTSGASVESNTIHVGPCIVPSCSANTTSLIFDPASAQPGEVFEMRVTLGFKKTFGSGGNADRIGNYYEGGFSQTSSYSNIVPNYLDPQSHSATSSNGNYLAIIGPVRATQAGKFRGQIHITAHSGGTNVSITCYFGEYPPGDPECPIPAGAGSTCYPTCLPSDTCDPDCPPGAGTCYEPCPVGDVSATGDTCDETCPTGSGCLGGFDASNQPFFKVYRGDVVAGAPIYDSFTNTCLTDSGDILAFNEGSGSYRGSAGQLGVIASSTIRGFISASLRTVAPTPPDGLSFANQGPDAPGGYGGFDNSCIDHFANATSPTIGSHTVSGASVSSDTIVYVDGDLTIAGDIMYDVTAGSWSIDDIPKIKYVARGNIYIRPHVAELHGTYIAMPKTTDGSGGEIFTCAPSNAAPTNSQLLDNCVKNDPSDSTPSVSQLRIYGTVIARRVHLHRLIGTWLLHDDPGGGDYNDPVTGANASEVFIESPLHWLSSFNIDGAGGDDSINPTQYESVTNLPPVL